MPSDSDDDDLSSSNHPTAVIRTKKSSSSMSQFEKNLMLSLIKMHNIVESKKSDFGTVQKKQNAWTAIELEFCSQPGVAPRSVPQLKTWWNNSKKRAKKTVAKRKRRLKKTGGGDTVSELPPDVEAIASIIPNQMQSLENPYDSNSIDKTNNDVGPDNELADDGKGKQAETEAVNADTSNANEPLSKKQKKEARSALLDFEYEEHKMRLKILSAKLETTLLHKKIAEKQLENLEKDPTTFVKLM